MFNNKIKLDLQILLIHFYYKSLTNIFWYCISLALLDFWAADSGFKGFRHLRLQQVNFILPGPPNFFMSRQYRQSPQSSRMQVRHFLHLILLTRLWLLVFGDSPSPTPPDPAPPFLSSAVLSPTWLIFTSVVLLDICSS